LDADFLRARRLSARKRFALGRKDIWPLITGAATTKPRTIYTGGPGFRSQALRDGDWKLVIHRGGSAKKDVTLETDKAELFNLAKDPNETTDLAPAMQDKVTACARSSRGFRADRDAVAKD